MIRHIVFFTVADPTERESVEVGLKLLEGNPHATRLEIRPNLKGDAWSTEVDFVVYGEFTDAAALAAYKAHPIYEEATRRVRPLRDLRIAADVETV